MNSLGMTIRECVTSLSTKEGFVLELTVRLANLLMSLLFNFCQLATKMLLKLG